MNEFREIGKDNSGSGSSKNGYRGKKDRSHIVVVPGVVPETYRCEACGKVFRDKKGKCYHDSCVTGIKPYKCSICERTFVKRSHFEYHERVHRGYKPFECTLCDKAFPQRNKLNRHTRSHKNEKEFSCEKCGKCYSKKEDLKNHATLHTGQRPHVCTHCGKSFGTPTNLNRHTRTHSNERPYTCELCSKSFKDNSLLIRHKKIHSRERPFGCAHCNRLFLTKSELTRHLVVHSDVKPFCCTYCRTIFRRKDNLDRHIRHHHQTENGAQATCVAPEKRTPAESASVSSRKTNDNKAKKASRIVPRAMKNQGKYGESAVEELTRGNSHDQINSRMDSLGNITPIIRGPCEFSNAVPVINGPMIGPKMSILSGASAERDSTDATRTKKKTYTYTEPIPLAEAVTINRRIEEKLYPQNSSLASNYYFFRKNTNTTEVSGKQENSVNTAGKFSTAPSGSRIVDATRQSDKDDRSIVSRDIDHFVPAIRINESPQQHFPETISIHHWRRRTAESYRSSRSTTD